MARRFWPNGHAVGQRIRRRDRVIEIVGVARDAKYLNLAETSRLSLYQPLARDPTNNPTLSLAARTTGDPLQLRSAIEREVKALVPAWPAFQFRTLDEGLRLQQLYGIGAADPLTYAAVPSLLLAVALLACYLPARRVARISPLEVLRYE